jgi:probable O-glycosylation ligase (exosortase A-associated)
MLRALFVTTIICYGLWQSFKSPFYAMLLYLWLAYFRPETWLWTDFVSQFNLSFVIGIFVLGTTLLSRRLRFGLGPTLMLLIAVQALISTMLSPAFDYSWAYWQDFAKSTVISFLIVTLVDNEKKLRQVFIVITLSIGIEAAKQGWAQLLLNPGAVNVNDIPNLGDNNGVAVGMLMLMPMLIALARTSTWNPERYGFRFMAVGIVYRAVSTFSRGGFLALAAVSMHFLLRSKRKVASALAIIVVVAMIAPVLPDYFWERMNTIPTDTESLENADSSAQSRIHFWKVAMVMANANPLTGVGHMAYNLVYDQYDFSNGQYGVFRSVHSSWFSVLSELGYPGFVLFLLLVGNCFRVARRAQRLAKQYPELKTLGGYANGIEAALIAFAVGGTFVIFQYTELLWHTFALSIVIDRLVTERTAALAAAPQPVATSVAATVRPRIGVAAAIAKPVRV